MNCVKIIAVTVFNKWMSGVDIEDFPCEGG
jgi:uncharacterized protein involved in cysteine biosynthesis